MDDLDPSPLQSSSATVHRDERGALTLVSAADIPFRPGRIYVLHGMPVGARRGGHASRGQRRLLVWISGASTVLVIDGLRLDDLLRLHAGETLLIEPGVWFEIEIATADTQILVFAEGEYEPDDYVRDRTALPVARLSASHTEPV